MLLRARAWHELIKCERIVAHLHGGVILTTLPVSSTDRSSSSVLFVPSIDELLMGFTSRQDATDEVRVFEFRRQSIDARERRIGGAQAGRSGMKRNAVFRRRQRTTP